MLAFLKAVDKMSKWETKRGPRTERAPRVGVSCFFTQLQLYPRPHKLGTISLTPVQDYFCCVIIYCQQRSSVGRPVNTEVTLMLAGLHLDFLNITLLRRFRE